MVSTMLWLGPIKQFHCLVQLSVLILVLTMSRLTQAEQCTNGREFKTQCSDPKIIKKSYLLGVSDDTVVIPCNVATSTWSHSQDGSRNGAVTLNDTSSEKYRRLPANMLEIKFSNITGRDGGLYRCVSDAGVSTDVLCVFVYERAVFASCPHEYSSGCTEEARLSVRAGESAKFNATVVYTPGGSCPDFQQDVTMIELRKINKMFGVENEILYSCLTSGETINTNCNNNRLSLDRGNKPGLEFVLTLTNTIHDNDSGTYEVIVQRIDPFTGGNEQRSLRKRFQLQVNPGPTMLITYTGTTTGTTSTHQPTQNSVKVPVTIGIIVFVLIGTVLMVVIVSVVVFLLRSHKNRKVNFQPVSLPPEKNDTLKLTINQTETVSPTGPVHAPGEETKRMYSGSVLETVHLPDIQGLSSEPTEVYLSCSAAGNRGSSNITVNFAHSPTGAQFVLRTGNATETEQEPSILSQQTAHV